MAEKAPIDLGEGHTSLTSRPHRCRRSRKARSGDSDVESFDEYCVEENTYGGSNVLGEGVFVDSVSLARARIRISPGHNRQSSMAMHDANTKTALHADVKGYDPGHPGLYSVAGSDSTGDDCLVARSS